MATPWNIRGSASPLFLQDKQLARYKAILAIADVPHPDRSILAAFINDAFDPEDAAQYFLHMTCAGDIATKPPKKTVPQFLSEWKMIIDKCEWTTPAMTCWLKWLRPSNIRFSSTDTCNPIVSHGENACLREGWRMLLHYTHTIQIIPGARPGIRSYVVASCV